MIWSNQWRRVRQVALAGSLAFTVAMQPPPAAAAAGVHLVHPGETLSEIAEAYGVSLRELAAINGIADENLIFAGTTLALPGTVAAAQPVTNAVADAHVAYRVREGDTLEGIAALFGTTYPQIVAANPEIVDPNLIFIGQILYVPDTSVALRVAYRPPNMRVAELLAEYAELYGLDPALVQALAWQESGWQQDVTSPAGATGVMQILPETGAWIAADIVGAPLDIAGSAPDNVLAGVAYLRWLIDTSGATELALVNYVQGQGSVTTYGVFPETQAYVANVLALRDYIAIYGEPPSP